MRTVYKYILAAVRQQFIDLPKGFDILHVGEQRGDICLWVEVNPEMETVPVKFFVIGTGHELPEAGKCLHLGTVILQPHHDLVFHVYQYDPWMAG